MQEKAQVDEIQAELLRRMASGDSAAVAEFYDQTAAPLFSIAMRILGDIAEAEEVIQEVFVQIWEKAGSFDPMLGSAFHGSLSITRHRSIDRLRSRQRRARLHEEFEKEGAASVSETNLEAKAFDSEEGKMIRAALKALPDEQREPIELAFFGGKTHVEIAETLKQPLGTIKARIRRGMLKLRDSLRGYA